MDPTNQQPVQNQEVHYEAITQGKKKKLSPLKKFTDNLFQGDINTVKEHVYKKIFIPMVQNTLMTVVNNALSMMFGNAPGVSNFNPYNTQMTNQNTTASIFRPYYVNYSQPQVQQQQSSVPTLPSSFDFDPIEISASVDPKTGQPISAEMICEQIKFQLEDGLAKFKKARVSELYELCGMSWNFTDQRYGWFNLQGMHYERTLNGTCLLYMPRPTLLPPDIQ